MQSGHSTQTGEMLDRLMRRTVFAQTDGIVRHHMNDPLMHQRAKTDGGAHVIGEDEERAGIGNDTAMQR